MSALDISYYEIKSLKKFKQVKNAALYKNFKNAAARFNNHKKIHCNKTSCNKRFNMYFDIF